MGPKGGSLSFVRKLMRSTAERRSDPKTSEGSTERRSDPKTSEGSTERRAASPGPEQVSDVWDQQDRKLRRSLGGCRCLTTERGGVCCFSAGFFLVRSSCFADGYAVGDRVVVSCVCVKKIES